MATGVAGARERAALPGGGRDDTSTTDAEALTLGEAEAHLQGPRGADEANIVPQNFSAELRSGLVGSTGGSGEVPMTGHREIIDLTDTESEETQSPSPKKRKVSRDAVMSNAGERLTFTGTLSGFRSEGWSGGAQPKAPNKNEIIDLTDDVDSSDDVYVDEVATNNPVCFGIIKTHVLVHVPLKFTTQEGEEPVHLVLEERSRFPGGVRAIRVEQPGGPPIGYVDMNTSGPVLAGLIAAKLIDVEASIPRTADTQFVASLYVTLYGPMRTAETVSNSFAANRIQIVDPLRPNPRFRYLNLHKYFSVDVNAFRPPAVVSRLPMRTPVKDAKSQIESLFASLQSPDNLPEVEPDHRLVSRLYKHQKQALYFMLEREKCSSFGVEESSKVNNLWQIKKDEPGVYVNNVTGEETREPKQLLGGILADDMGLGKTITVISLVLGSLGQTSSVASHLEVDAEAARALRVASAGASGPEPVFVGHQSEILDEDELEFEVHVAQIGRGRTLVVCPLSTVANWEDQFKMHVARDIVSVYVYHGNARKNDPRFLASQDVVITTYSVLAAEYSRQERMFCTRKLSVLQQISWLRVVLDEAHMIKDPNTIQSKAACSLTAERRWSLTGTPIQNKLDDLFAQVKFLKIGSLGQRQTWNDLISKPLKDGEALAVSRLQALMRCITLRRTKNQKVNGEPILNLPPRNDEQRNLQFDAHEQSLYDKMLAHTTMTVENLMRDDNVLKNYVHILQAILRLRQLCVHPALCDTAVILGDEAASQNMSLQKALSAFSLLREAGSDQCTMCFRDASATPVISRCDHLFCAECIYRALRSAGGRHACPTCRQPLDRDTLIDLTNIEGKEEGAPAESRKSDAHVHSTKLKALVKDLQANAQSALGKRTKSVVFSQWTSNLDLIEMALKEAGHRFVRFDGAMVRADRARSIDVFRTDPDVPVILMSLKAGGVGLNLTCAQRVYLMDPYWNPAVESQAIDRVHRMGQEEPVTCVRFIMKNSIEENMLQLQEKKLRLSEITFEKPSKQDVINRRTKDVRFLVYGEQEMDGSGTSTRLPSTQNSAGSGSIAAKQQLSQHVQVVSCSIATPAFVRQPVSLRDPALLVYENADKNDSMGIIRPEPQPEVIVLDAESPVDSPSASPPSSITQGLDTTRTPKAIDFTSEILLSPSRPRPEASPLSAAQGLEATQTSKGIHNASGFLLSPPLLRATAGEDPEGVRGAFLAQVDDYQRALVRLSSSSFSAEPHRRSTGAGGGLPESAQPAVAVAQDRNSGQVPSERRETAVHQGLNANG